MSVIGLPCRTAAGVDVGGYADGRVGRHGCDVCGSSELNVHEVLKNRFYFVMSNDFCIFALSSARVQVL